MKIAITGASGFIGRHVLGQLVARGYPTIAATSGQPPACDSGLVRQVSLDLHDPSIEPSDSLGNPDILIHLAWSGLPHYHSSHHMEHELPAQKRFLTACVRSGIRRILVAGTCFEYGMTSGELIESQALSPVTTYGSAKKALLEHLLELRQSGSFELVWARLFYLYGSGQSPSSLYAQLQAAMARGDDGFDMSAGEQVRDFLPVDLAAHALVSLATNACESGIVNVCSGKPERVKDRVARWISESGSNIRMNLGRLPYPTFEPMAFWGSRRKLDAILGHP